MITGLIIGFIIGAIVSFLFFRKNPTAKATAEVIVDKAKDKIEEVKADVQTKIEENK